jgi:ABC-type phosphate transport system substrate-binding protein
MSPSRSNSRKGAANTTKIATRLFQSAFLMAPVLLAQGPETCLIVNKTNPVTSLSKAQARKLLTGAQTTWPGGERVVLLMPALGDPTRAQALKKCCGMTEQQYAGDLLHANFLGEERVEPKTLPSAKAIVDAVQTLRGAIAVVGCGQVTNQVRMVSFE